MLALTAMANAASGWSWTETFAERMVVKKTLIPCQRVRKLPRCSVAVAENRVRQFDDAVAACDQYDEDGKITCLASLEIQPDPRIELRHVQRGFPVETAECVGGAPDKSGFRFRQFRCKVTVNDYNWLTQRVLKVGGRIVVYVTGSRTMRFAVIP